MELNLPESLSAHEEVTLEAIVRQDEELVDKANFVHFEIWKQDVSIYYPMDEATVVGNGAYHMKVRFESDDPK